MASELRVPNSTLSQFRSVNSPANRPKWNAVSKTRSVNTLYDSQLLNSNTIRKGWDLELRRKRVHKLPPLKRKRHHEEIPHIPSEVLPLTNGPITSECNYDQSSTGQDHMTSIGYLTSSSRRSSKALVPLRSVPDLPLSIETPRSQRPVQQEWYEEITKSRSTQRTNPPRTRNNSIQDSIGSNQHTNSSRDIFTLRSSTRNSQNSLLSSTLIDSSIRTNRATELRLSRDMDEYHQHSHSPSESMPFAIRGFELSGTPLTVPENATIRPLSNVNYRASERIKTRRIFPWSSLHQYGATTRNSVLLPITEFRHPSFETTVMDTPRIIHDEQQ